MLDDAKILIRLMKSGTSKTIIAAKLGISVEEVERRWEDLRILATAVNGHDELVVQYATMCHQYQLLGESLKIVAKALGNAMPPNEIEKLLDADPKKSLHNLNQSCIILRPFVQQNPEESLKEHLKRQQSGN